MRGVIRQLADDDPRNIFTQAHFDKAWSALAYALGEVLANEHFDEIYRTASREPLKVVAD